VAADSREKLTRNNRRHFGRLMNRTLLYYVKTHLGLLLGLCLSSTANFRLFRGVRKVVKSDYSLVSLSVRLFLRQSAPKRARKLPLNVFSWNCYLSIFPKSFQKIKVSLKSDKNNRYLIQSAIYIYGNISLSSS